MPHPDALMSRQEVSSALAQVGIKVAPHSLACIASYGAGPCYIRIGGRVRYRWSEALEWGVARQVRIERCGDRSRVREMLNA